MLWWWWWSGSYGGGSGGGCGDDDYDDGEHGDGGGGGVGSDVPAYSGYSILSHNIVKMISIVSNVQQCSPKDLDLVCVKVIKK